MNNTDGPTIHHPPTKDVSSRHFGTNRYSLRIEIAATPTKQTAGTRANRYKSADPSGSQGLSRRFGMQTLRRRRRTSKRRRKIYPEQAHIQNSPQLSHNKRKDIFYPEQKHPFRFAKLSPPVVPQW